MSTLSYEQLQQAWVQAGGPPSEARVAAAIAEAESSGSLTAIHNTAYPDKPGYSPPAPGNQPEYSVGPWQVNELAHPSYSTGTLETALGAARAAVAISNRGTDFHPWSTYTSGAYLGYLSGGSSPAPGSTGATSAASGTSGSASDSSSGGGGLDLGAILKELLLRAGELILGLFLIYLGLKALGVNLNLPSPQMPWIGQQPLPAPTTPLGAPGAA